MAAGSLLAAGRPQEIRAQARSPDRPNPTMEDAFIQLLQQSEQTPS
jgi:ABC-2 type transport system ATP-binding protein